MLHAIAGLLLGWGDVDDQRVALMREGRPVATNRDALPAGLDAVDVRAAG